MKFDEKFVKSLSDSDLAAVNGGVDLFGTGQDYTPTELLELYAQNTALVQSMLPAWAAENPDLVQQVISEFDDAGVSIPDDLKALLGIN